MSAMTPNQPKTPARNIRVSDELWSAARTKADREGTTVTAVLVAFLEQWVSEPHGGGIEAATGDPS